MEIKLSNKQGAMNTTYDNPYHRIPESMDDISQQGFINIDGHDVLNNLPSNLCHENIQDFWSNLELDKYMNDNGVYRKRKFASFEYDEDTKTLSFLKDRNTFYQSSDINKLNGGVNRQFSIIENDFSESIFLQSLVRYCIDLLPLKEKIYSSININVHQFRISCQPGSFGMPTPEGIHNDGHHFVSQHLISRKYISGGVSGIYCNEKNPIKHRQLNSFMDTIIVDDNKVKHDVSPIISIDSKEVGYRDMLIIDYILLQ